GACAKCWRRLHTSERPGVARVASDRTFHRPENSAIEAGEFFLPIHGTLRVGISHKRPAHNRWRKNPSRLFIRATKVNRFLRGGSASPKTMPKLIADVVDIRRQSRSISNTLRTTRSTLRLAHLFVNTFGLRKMNSSVPDSQIREIKKAQER